jgi:hypothetical protein
MPSILHLPPLHPLKALQQQLTGVSHHVLKSDIRAGRLVATKIGGRWWITEDAIRAYLALPPDTCITREIA